MAYYHHQVTPFGNLRIKAHLRLPEAYRSLARPSSPVSTKASTVCPLKLDSNFEISHAASGPLAETFTTLCRPCGLPTARHLHAGLCRKNYICIWDSNISPRPRKNGSFERTLFFAVRKKLFLHVDVKERTCLKKGFLQDQGCGFFAPVGCGVLFVPALGRPDRT